MRDANHCNNPPTAYYYLNQDARSNLLRFQYKGQDQSLLYNHVLSPLASFLVNHCTPVWIAPNAITLFGLCWMIVSYVTLWYYAPEVSMPMSSNPNHSPLLDLDDNSIVNESTSTTIDYRDSEGIPSWVFAFHGCALLIYQTLDNMDGKQARRTGTSSPLGLLFDHGCDAINSIFGSAGWILGLGLTLSHDYFMCLAIVLGPFAMFYVATWEEYFTGQLVLPVINGPNEGLLGGALLSFTTCLYPDFWQSTSIFDALGLHHLFSFPLRNADLQVSLALFGMLQEIVVKSIHVSHQYGIRTLTHQAPLWILIAFVMLMDNLWMSMPRTTLHLSSGLFVEIVTHLMLDHITNQPNHVLRRCIILLPLIMLTFIELLMESFPTLPLFSLSPIASFLDPDTSFRFYSMPMWWLIYTTAVWTFLFCKIQGVVHELCCALNLKCFKIPIVIEKPKVT